MSRVILHLDANSFYASVECLYRPEIRNKPVSVCGDPEDWRSGTSSKRCAEASPGQKRSDAAIIR